MKGRQGRKKATERKLSFNVQLEQLVERDEGPEDSLPQGIVHHLLDEDDVDDVDKNAVPLRG